MFCRPCGREHRGPECPVDELGRPSPAPGLVRAQAPRWTLPTPTFAGSVTTSATNAASVNVTVLFATGTIPRPHDDDGLAGVPALVRR